MEVTINKDGNTVIAKVSGSINSTNSGEFENALADYPGEYDGVIIDAKELEYISSAGLRVILNTKKRCKDKVFKVINVSNDVKNIFDVTGFSEIIEVTGASRQLSVEGCKVIGHGACGECFRIDDETIVKLYYPHVPDEEIEREKALAKKAFVLGIPTAISYDVIECDGRKGVVYELIKSKTIAELIRDNPESKDEYLDKYVDVCKKMATITTDDKDIPSFKDINDTDIKKIVGISDEERDYLHKFISIVPDGDTCIHGDLNINNIMVENGECVLIDMGELSRGIYLWDISRIIFSMYYANTNPGEMNSFYKMSSEEVSDLYNEFINKYFGCGLEEAVKTIEYGEWLLPLTWFRCCTSMIRENRFPEDKVNMAKDMLRNKLIPFVKEHLK